jgi:hypothetical protein
MFSDWIPSQDFLLSEQFQDYLILWIFQELIEFNGIVTWVVGNKSSNQQVLQGFQRILYDVSVFLEECVPIIYLTGIEKYPE